jgi:putative membrane protein
MLWYAPEKTFTSQMVTDHTTTSTDLKRLVSASKVKVELPTALNSSHQSLTSSKVRAARTSAPMQVRAHKDAVSLFERMPTTAIMPT